MKAQPFNITSRRWDEYRAFHHYLSRYLVMFDTGEMIYEYHDPDPDFRKRFRDHEIQIVATTDADCPKLYTSDGTEVKKAWITRKGLQHLAVDYERGVVVRLQSPSDQRHDTRLPPRFVGKAAVYWSGAERRPVGAPTILSIPRTFTPEENAHILQTISACKAWAAMNGVDTQLWTDYTLLDGTTFRPKSRPNTWQSQYSPLKKSTLLSTSFAEMPNQSRWEWTVYTPEPDFTEIKHDYLYLTPHGEKGALK